MTRSLNTVALDPRYLELEMTESMLLKNVDENIAVLRKLGTPGTSLAADDEREAPGAARCAEKRKCLQRVNSRIARCSPSRVSGYMRPPIRLRIMPMDS